MKYLTICDDQFDTRGFLWVREHYKGTEQSVRSIQISDCIANFLIKQFGEKHYKLEGVWIINVHK